MWLLSPLPLGSVRVSFATKTPDTTVVGTVHCAETAQLPQSKFSVAVSLRQAGWV
jgi:hypothetical protein